MNPYNNSPIKAHLDPPQITIEIKKAENEKSLVNIFKQYGLQLNEIHLNLLLFQATKLKCKSFPVADVVTKAKQIGFDKFSTPNLKYFSENLKKLSSDETTIKEIDECLKTRDKDVSSDESAKQLTSLINKSDKLNQLFSMRSQEFNSTHYNVFLNRVVKNNTINASLTRDVLKRAEEIGFETFSPMELSTFYNNLLKALPYAEIKEVEDALMVKLSKIQPDEFKPRNNFRSKNDPALFNQWALSNLVHSFGVSKNDSEDAQIFTLIFSDYVSDVRDALNALWTICTTRYYAHKATKKYINLLIDTQTNKLTQGNYCQLIYSLGLIKVFIQEDLKKKKYKKQLGELNSLADKLIEKCVKNIDPEHEFSTESKAQIFSYCLFVKPDNKKLESIINTYNPYNRSNPSNSQIQIFKDIERKIDKTKYNIILEASVEGFEVDICCENKKSKVKHLIEINGPHHYTTSSELDGSSYSKVVYLSRFENHRVIICKLEPNKSKSTIANNIIKTINQNEDNHIQFL